METDYEVVVLAVCLGCNKTFTKIYPLHIPGYLNNLKYIEGRILTEPQRFVREKIVFDSCKCHLTFDRERLILIQKGFLVNRDDKDSCEDIFGRSREELTRERKRIRLAVEWETEQRNNRDYWCEKCKKPFLQPLPKSGEERLKICHQCNKIMI